LVGEALAATVDADIAVGRTEGSRYVAHVRVRSHDGRAGERSLEEATCEVVADAVATVVAMSLDASAPGHEAPDGISIAPERPAMEGTRSSLPSEPHVTAGLVAMVDEGTLPFPALGAGVALAWYPVTPVRVEAALLRWLDQSTTVEGQAFGGTFQLTSADLRSCWSLLGRTVTFGPCTGVEIAHLEAKGFKSTTLESGHETWWSPSVGGLLHWAPLHAIGFAALADVVFPVSRPTFVIVNGGEIHQAAFASLRGQIVAEVRF
jgi:hypothetical protein